MKKTYILLLIFIFSSIFSNPLIAQETLNIGDRVTKNLAYMQLLTPSSYTFTAATDMDIVIYILNPFVDMGTGKCIYLNTYSETSQSYISSRAICASGQNIMMLPVTISQDTYRLELSKMPEEVEVSQFSLPAWDINLPPIEANSASVTVDIITSEPTGTPIRPEPPTPNASLSASKNYVRTKTYTSESGNVYLDQIQYFDGLGRPEQAVQRKITPQGNDLVSLQTYDTFGREAESWLPGLSTGNGAYVSPATIKAKAIELHSNDAKPYSIPVYEQSPLNRVLAQYGPGADWHKTYGNDSKAVRTEYLANSGTSGVLSCALFVIEGSGLAVKVKKNGFYDSSQLYVTQIKDEDGNTSYEFKDKLGQVVLTRQMNGSTQHDTYYVYDDFGNLCFVLPPLASEVHITNNGTAYNEANSTPINRYAYLYKYDERNRCIAKKLPGCDWIYYVYDKADQLIFIQDGEQRVRSEWTFSIPDAFGRIVLTGTCKNSLNYVADPLKNTAVRANRANATNTYKGYGTPTGVTLATPTILSVSYYDDYAFLGYNGIPNNTNTQYVTESGYGVCYGDHQAANKLKNKGLLTGTLTAQMNADGTVNATYLYSIMYYDTKGQVVQTKSKNHLSGGIEKEYIAYNFIGQPIQRKHIHMATGKNTQTELYTYAYDHAGRLLKTTHQLTDGATVKPQVTLAENEYDELGRLKTNKKNNQANLNTTYTYNVRSWTKSIASPLFNQTLFYNESYGGSAKRYNGNISAMSWKLSTESVTRGYAFTYDGLSQLTVAQYLQNGAANTNYKTSYTYDKHGNMKTLQRYGKTTSTAYGLIDNVTLTYTGNQLTKADDAVATISLAESNDFKNYINTATEYTYNKNGAMTKDLNRGINEIKYNSLNLPQQMDIKSPVGEARNMYVYSASGQKLRVTSTWNPNYSSSPVIGSAINTSSLTQQKVTDYVGNKIYEQQNLKRILIEGGYIENNQYHFYLTDHLGNNRVVANTTGGVIQKNHYYPFGMPYAETSKAEQLKQPYKFGDKELDQMHGLNHYDFSARYMDGIRFTSVDPHAENYFSWSPYAYVGNNPMRLTDPTGMDWYEDEDGNATWHRNQTGAEYKDENGKVWKRTGDTRTVVTADNQAIVFGQKTDKDGNQTLTSTVYHFGEDKLDAQNENNFHFEAAALLMNASFQSGNSPIPGDQDFRVWSMAASFALYGVAVETTSLFSKTARGNHRDDGLRDWTDEDIAGALGGLVGHLTAEQKALKQRLTKEQKVRGNRNVQKKGTEKGTGTGRK